MRNEDPNPRDRSLKLGWCQEKGNIGNLDVEIVQKASIHAGFEHL